MKTFNSFLLIMGIGIGGLASSGASVHAAGGTMALMPASSVVDPLEVFDLELTVLAGSDSFNAYEVDIEFDPALLTFIQLTPLSQQEGQLMTSACGNRFHIFDEIDGDIGVTHSLLCAGVRVAGPGIVYRLRFQAGADNGITTVGFTSVRMVNAGIPFSEVVVEDAVIQIGNVTGVGDGPFLQPVLSPPYPNPSRGPVRFAVSPTGDAPVTLRIFAVSGKQVRSLFRSNGRGADIVWDRRDDRGLPVEPGVYYVRLLDAAGSAVRRIVLLDP
jgi:hypothetical protein